MKEQPPAIATSSSLESALPDARTSSSELSFFQGSSNVRIDNSNLNNIHGNLINIRFGDGPFTDTQREQVRDFIANIVTLPDIEGKLAKHILIQSVRDLPRSQAAYDDYKTKKKSGACFKGTREAILQEMADWATAAGESRIYALYGLAGIGKSTIAYTIAERADKLGLLGGSFFFSRDEADRRTAHKFFTTLAFQLCVYEKTFADVIGAALLTERGAAATTKDPNEQLHALILEPLRDIVAGRLHPILIVVDALDECEEKDWPSVLAALKMLVRALPSFKIILTMRPQPRLDLTNRDGHKIFHLQDIEAKIVDGDIRLYLENNLSQEQVQSELGDPEEQWHASDAEIDSLVQVAGSLFIIASTSVRFILDKFASDPAGRMEMLLHSFGLDRTPLKDLNLFYTIILRNAVPEDCEDDVVKRHQSIVGAIVLTQQPLPVRGLACLIGRKDKEITTVLRNLRSVILLGSDNIPRIYHKSFSDYITDRRRCTDANLQIDTKFNHTRLAYYCLKSMNGCLKYNILGLGDPARFMENREGLKHQGISARTLQKKIPLELQYSCVYWSNHLKYADDEPNQELEKFANEHLLHWLEVLSWIERLESAHRALDIAVEFLNNQIASFGLHHLLSDGMRFVQKFYETIQQSALHTYYSALPFTPTESPLYWRYNDEALHGLCRVYGGPKRWDALLASPSHWEGLDHIAFSPDNTMWVALSHRGLKLLDGRTGIPLRTIAADSVTIAANFSIVASSLLTRCTPCTVTLKGNTITNLPTSGARPILALSSDGSRIAIGSSGDTVRLWNVNTGQLVASLAGFQYRNHLVYGELDEEDEDGKLAFSISGARLAYLLVGGCGVRLVDGMNGELLADLNCQSEVRRFKFSCDGSRIAILTSGVEDALSLWNPKNGDSVGVAKFKGTGDWPLGISDNGSLIATSSFGSDEGDGEFLSVWTEGHTRNTLLRRLSLIEVECVVSLEFSPNEMLAALSLDWVTLFDPRSGAVILTLPSYSRPRVLAFSSDCNRLAVGSGTGIMYLWDLQSIRESSFPSRAQSRHGRVTDLVLSQDRSRLACGYTDGTFQLWETRLSTRLITSIGLPSYIRQINCSPDGKIFTSISMTIRLWNGENGMEIGTPQHYAFPSYSPGMELSNSMLAIRHPERTFLWELDTLSFAGAVQQSADRLSFSNNGSLLAVSESDRYRIDLFDVEQLTAIATFEIPTSWVRRMMFQRDDSQLVVELPDHDSQFQSFDIATKQLKWGRRFEILSQLDCLLLYGTPVWWREDGGISRLEGLFPQHESPVPVLWIPEDLGVNGLNIVQAPSMIVLDSKNPNGHTIFIQSSSSLQQIDFESIVEANSYTCQI